MTSRTASDPLPPARSKTVRVRTRWDDCDRNGHVNNAASAALVRAAHDRAGLPDRPLRALTIAYREPVGPEVTIDVDVTIGEATATQQRVTYALRVDGRPAAYAEALWQVSPEPEIPPALPTLARDSDGRPFHFTQVVRSYQLGPDAVARPQAILQWLEHAVFRAAARAGWPAERMIDADFLTLVVEHRLVLASPAHEGDELEIRSRLIELRRVSGIWHHEVRRPDGAIVAIDRARGAFLGLDGRIRPAPTGMLDALLRGEPGD
jgi:acyl-CoA thioesterase FadM